MKRPDWLPMNAIHQWRYGRCDVCLRPNDVHLVQHEGLRTEFCDSADSPDCEAKAKAAICGGDDG